MQSDVSSFFSAPMILSNADTSHVTKLPFRAADKKLILSANGVRIFGMQLNTPPSEIRPHSLTPRQAEAPYKS